MTLAGIKDASGGSVKRAARGVLFSPLPHQHTASVQI